MRFHSEPTSKISTLASSLRGRLTARRDRSVGRAARQVVEQLEARKLMAVVAAGEQAIFYDGTNRVRINVTGEGSITLVGFTRPRDATSGAPTGLSELPLSVFEADGDVRTYAGGFNDGAGGSSQPPNYEIYSIHSGDSTSETSVSITRITDEGEPEPFESDAGQLRTNMRDPGDNVNRTISLSNGGVFIGGRSGTAADRLFPVYSQVKNVSIATSPGVSLRRNAVLKPGLYVNGSLDNFLLGGTITGGVNISGSVDTFYAGNVLTGDVFRGANATPVVIGTDNFTVGGDLRNLITAGGIGTVAGAPRAFIPGTDIQVGGRVQQIKSGGDFRASVDAIGNYDEDRSDGSDMTELEGRTASNADDFALGVAFLNDFSLVNQDFANNDSFASPQILGSYFNPERDRGQQARVNGVLNNLPTVGDNVDFYGLPLIAGQTAVVQVETVENEFGFLPAGPVALQVYDPDGNIVFSDYSNQNPFEFLNKQFKITADQPGLWRLAVVPQRTSLLTERPYTLTVDNHGELAIGGVQSGNAGEGGAGSGGEMWLSNATIGIRGRNADVGAVLAGGDLFSTLGLTTLNGQPEILNAIVSDRGNTRSVEADNFAREDNGTLFTATFPTILAGKSVGLVRTSEGRLFFNQFSRAADDTPSVNLGIGGDYQVIETPGDFSAVLSANGGIGVIRVGTIGTDGRTQDPGYFEINADGRGNDGVLGLIDVEGDMGTFGRGGPAIRGGQGSNVRYIRVAGNAYRDIFFGAGNTLVARRTNTALPAVLDDSGAQIVITPIASTPYTAPDDLLNPNAPIPVFGTPGNPPVFGTPTLIPNPFGGPGTVTPTTDVNGDGVIDADDLPVTEVDEDGNIIDLTNAGTITVETYPIRTGGSVILGVTATEGVQINSSGSGATASGDISEIRTGNEGAQIITNSSGALLPSQEEPAELDSGDTLEVLLTGTGNVRTNVFSIAGTSTSDLADYTRVVNATDGEIVNLNADSVAYLEAQLLGVGRTAANVTVEGRNQVADTRFNNAAPVGMTRNLIRMGDGIEIRSRGAVGNVAAVGVIQNVVANSDARNTRGLHEGINGIVYAGSELRNVEIGEGSQTSGTGTQIRAGIFSNDTVGTITNVNGGGDLRGDVIFRQNLEAVALTGGGSIYDADLIQVGNITGPEALTRGDEQSGTNIELVGGIDTDAGIGTITLTGDGGGIINAQIVGLNLGLTTVGDGGFGVINSRFFSSGGGRMEGISAAGLGIRGTIYTGGGQMGDIVATGSGRVADLDEYSLSARGSDLALFDVATGIKPNAANDLYVYFRTSEEDSSISGRTNEGMIADTTIAASQSIGNIRAFEFRTFNNDLGTRPRDESFPNQINFGQSIGSISAKRDIDGLRVVGASLGQIVARDIKQFQLQATGPVGTINAKRNVLGTVNFNLTNDGFLSNLLVGGYFNGTAFAARGIDRIVVDGDLASQRTSGGIYSGLNIRSVRIGGDVREGSYIRARKKMSGITINGDLEANATIRANPFGTVTIKGATDGKIQRN